MTIVERGKSFQISVGSGKDRFRATAASMEEAKLIEAREVLKRQQIALGAIQATPQVAPKVNVTMQRLFELAKRRKWNSTRSDAMVSNAARILEDIGAMTSVQDINREYINELIEELFDRGNSGSTINRKLSCLSVMLNIAEEEGWIEHVPKITRQSEAKHRVCFFNAAEEREMLSLCEKLGFPELADFIVFGIETGFRRNEILGLSVRDCDDGSAVLHAGKTKSGLARSVPLTAPAQAVVDRRRALGYEMLFPELTKAKLRTRWLVLKQHYSNPGDHFIVHTLRHTCASRLAITGHNAPFIQAWMGHSSIMVTQRYMHLAPDTLKAGVVSLENYRNKAA